MIKISQKQEKILFLFLQYGHLRSSQLHDQLSKAGMEMSLVTVKRELSRLSSVALITALGKGRARVYEISPLGRLFVQVDAAAYCAIDPDKRFGLGRFNFDLLPAIPSEIFSSAEREILDNATAEYRRRTTDLPPSIEKKELERLIIELSWKSSKIEGNTYTLLDTEKLILEHKEAPGHDRKEASMILNHKAAFTFVREHAKEFRTLTRANLERLHEIIVKGLGVSRGLRETPVGVLGSKYHPLDNVHQIRDAVAMLASTVSRMETPYGKALIALLGVSYIQPFEDGNKRTARLMANALLLAHRCAPLSYRSVDEKEYREAMLVFYELNSLTAFQDIFVTQYDFAARNYAVK